MLPAALALAPAIFSSAAVRPCRGAAPGILSSNSGRPRRGARGAVRCEVASSSAPSTAGPQTAKWAQRTVVIPPQSRGCHLITPKIVNEIRDDLAQFKCGMAHLFLQHTSASLTINENYDSDVQADTETFLSRIVPEGPSAPWRHTMEGPDDMPAHIKSSMFGCSLMIPITNGRLNMGTWQIAWLRRGLQHPKCCHSMIKLAQIFSTLCHHVSSEDKSVLLSRWFYQLDLSLQPNDMVFSAWLLTVSGIIADELQVCNHGAHSWRRIDRDLKAVETLVTEWGQCSKS